VLKVFIDKNIKERKSGSALIVVGAPCLEAPNYLTVYLKG
jgi:hypothetical protein